MSVFRAALLGLLGLCGCVAAVAQTPNIVLLTTYVVPPARLASLQAAALQAGVAMQTLSAEQDTLEHLQTALRSASLLVLDTPHPSVAQTAAARFGGVINQSSKPYVMVGEFAAVAKNERLAAAPLKTDSGVSLEWAQRLREYWRFGGAQNMRLAMQALKNAATQTTDAMPPAVQLPLQGFYNPTWPQIENNAAAALKNLENSTFYQLNTPLAQSIRVQTAINTEAPKTVAIAVNNAVFTSNDTPWLDAMITALERRGLRAYAFYGPRQQKDLFHQATHISTATGQQRRADVIINSALVFNPTERKAELERIGVPVLQTMPALAMDPVQWAQSKDGLALSDVAYYYTPSELLGLVDPLLITARNAKTGALEPISQQINAVADKAAALARLQSAPTAQRRVAMMVYNYPQGEGNFGASFLNVP